MCEDKNEIKFNPNIKIDINPTKYKYITKSINFNNEKKNKKNKNFTVGSQESDSGGKSKQNKI